MDDFLPLSGLALLGALTLASMAMAIAQRRPRLLPVPRKRPHPASGR